jgi:hypothetical protein
VFPSVEQRRALAEIDAAIDQTATNRRQQLSTVDRLAKAGKATAGIAVWLRRTDDHLDDLRRRRHSLLVDLAADD